MRNAVLALLVLLVPGAFAPAGQGKASPGQPLPELELRTVLGGDGRTRLSEFHGQPVLIAWYSTVFAGIEAARAAVGMEEDFNGRSPEGPLAVFLMEIKDHDATYLRALQMAELPGARCRLLRKQDLPVAYDDSLGPPPKLILVGVDGTLLYAGSYQRASVVKELVEAELEKMQKGWGEDPLARKARALAFGQGKLGEARQMLAAASGEGGDEQAALAAQLEARFTALGRSVKCFLDQGEPGRAAAAAEALATAAQGRPDWVARADAAGAALAETSGREAELEQRLQALLRPAQRSKPKKGLDEKLRAFAAGEASGTKVGERAARLADAVARIEEGL